MMIIKATGEWVILEKNEKEEGMFVVIDSQSANIISVGEECPESIQQISGEVVYHNRSEVEMEGLIAINWRDILWQVTE